MLNYETLKKKPKKLLALTGLARREFEEVLPVFAKALNKTEAKIHAKTSRRKRATGAGRKPGLRTLEDKLLFALVYTKTYPLQVVQGQLFEMSQSSASEWIHFLLPILAEALAALKVMPERDGSRLAQHERRRAESFDLIVDGVERRRQRPKDPIKQTLHYSGKKKGHYDKNLVVANTQSKRIGFLSRTLPGIAHDKAMADWAEIRYPRGTTLRSDLGFWGYAPQVQRHVQPKKSQRRRT